MMFRHSLLFLLFAAGSASPGATRSADPVKETLSGFEEAIRLSEQLSREERSHARQMRLLESEVETLQAELDQTRKRIRGIESQRTEALAKREELVRQRSEERKMLDLVDSLVAGIFPTLEKIENELPPWIDSELPGEEAPSGATLLYLRNLFAENQTIRSQRAEIKDPGDGQPVLVDLVSFGLAGAFFASPDGTFGGRYVYDGVEWSPEVIDDFAPPIHRMVRQEEGLEEPELISLPVTIGGNR